MELQGTIKVIGETQVLGEKEFKKRQVVISTNEKYSQDIPVDFVQDKVDVLNSYKIGDSVTIGINLRGSEWKGKYYASIQGWKINKEEGTTPAPVENNGAEPDVLPF